MSAVQVDWSSAHVRGGELNVQFAAEPSSAWRKRFETLARRLERPGESWGEITVKKTRIRVREISEGAESDVHHFLDSILLERRCSPRSASCDVPSTRCSHAAERSSSLRGSRVRGVASRRESQHSR